MRSRFTINNYVSELNSTIGTSLVIIRLAITQLVIAGIMAFGLAPATAWVGRLCLYDKLIDATPSLLNHKIATDSIVDMYAITAGISGALLGLYFTALSVLFGTAYAEVSSDVKAYLIKEKLSSKHVSMLSYTTAYSGLLALKVVLGFNVAGVDLVFPMALTSIAVLGAIAQGWRTFVLVDPSGLVGDVKKDLVQYVHMVSSRTPFWSNASFQSYFHKMADRRLLTLRDITLFCTSRSSVDTDTLNMLASTCLWLLTSYMKIKPTIPPQSNWFRMKNSHQNWLRASETEITISLKTGTLIQPKHIPEPSWYEKEIINSLCIIYRKLIEVNKLSVLSSSMYRCIYTTRRLASLFGIEEARLLVDSLRNIAIEAQKSSAEVNDIICTWDLYTCAFIELVIGLTESLDSLTADGIKDTLTKIDWRRHNTIYKTVMPQKVVQQLEFLAHRIVLELNVENNIVTPPWYLEQMVALSYLRWLAEILETFIGDITTFIISEANRVTADSPILSIHILVKGIEVYHKIDTFLESATKCAEMLGKFRYISDIPWPEIDIDQYKDANENEKKQLLTILARVVSSSIDNELSDQLPDYIGFSYTVLLEECYTSIVKGDEESLGKYLPTCFLLSEVLRRRALGMNELTQDSRLYLSTDLILDIIAISGFALIYSRLDHTNIFNGVSTMWDNYLRSFKDDFARYIMAILEYRTSQPMISPRDLVRTRWKQSFEQDMFARGLGEEEFVFPGMQQTPHPDPLIRTVLRSLSIFDAEDIFVAGYVINKFGLSADKFDWKVKELYDNVYAGEDRDASCE